MERVCTRTSREQLRGQYALGCLAYELITGRVPFACQGLTSIMGQPSNAQPAPLSERVADLPPLLEAEASQNILAGGAAVGNCSGFFQENKNSPL